MLANFLMIVFGNAIPMSLARLLADPRIEFNASAEDGPISGGSLEVELHHGSEGPQHPSTPMSLASLLPGAVNSTCS